MLLDQWGTWQQSELNQLGVGVNSWQRDYRGSGGYEEEKLPQGDDNDMLIVEAAIIRLKGNQARHYRVILVSQRDRQPVNIQAYNAAVRAFMLEYGED